MDNNHEPIPDVMDETPSPLSKKERREQRKDEQRRAQQSQQRKSAQKRTITWAVVGLAVALIGYGVYLLVPRTTTPRPGETIAIQGRDHIAVGASHADYNSNPPTSGSHYARATEWGVYGDELLDENVIHSLEHGGIWISYQPDIDEETKGALEAIGRRFSGSVVVSPRAANDTLIAVASWGRLEKMTAFDEDRIVAYIKRNKNNSPEPLAR